eukprot:SAG11_NODE_9325_length_921_cov_4.981752_1_plen_165_part_00
MAFNMVSQSGTPRSIAKITHDVGLLRARMHQTDTDFSTELAAHTHVVATTFAAQLTSGKSFNDIAVSDVLEAVERHMAPNFQAADFRLVWEGSYIQACGNTPLAQLEERHRHAQEGQGRLFLATVGRAHCAQVEWAGLGCTQRFTSTRDITLWSGGPRRRRRGH